MLLSCLGALSLNELLLTLTGLCCYRCYFAVSFTGYWAFGINVADNVLMTPALKSTVPNGLIIAADMFVVIHVLGSFQVYSMPVRATFPCLTHESPHGST